MYPFPRRVRDNSTWSSILVVAGVAAVVSIPWAVVHGPVELKWVLAQALGVAVIPAAAGWVTLWQTKGDRGAALRVVVGVAAVLLGTDVWSVVRGGR
jgi:hypothetical protein